ncbi:MAG: type II secretion system protein [Luteolibacter sp.]
MKFSTSIRQRGFTLLETVIAIGVLAVLLTGFMVVFAPAAAGIRKSINVQEADRLASTVEQEMVTFRKGDESGLPSKTAYTGFDKAYTWIENSSAAASAILVYQYRGELGGTARPDGTPEPVIDVKNKLAGKDYVVVPMARRVDSANFTKDIAALEGGVYLVKCTQLVFGGATAGLTLSTSKKIVDPKGTGGGAVSGTDTYPEAVIAFAADFYMLPGKSSSFFGGGSAASYKTAFDKAKTPVFTRNLAVRR